MTIETLAVNCSVRYWRTTGAADYALVAVPPGEGQARQVVTTFPLAGRQSYP
ncbi:MAG: hypothetical protein ACUVQR_02170 [Thermogutta sp.]